jgi:GxxExxY protein
LGAVEPERSMTENEVGTMIVQTAIAVHRELGPGLFESVYQLALACELQELGMQVEEQFPITISYKGRILGDAFRADLLVDRKVILELKSVEQTTAAHRKQIQTYLRLSGFKLGYLLNFGEALMKDGITRCVNGLEENPFQRPKRKRFR